MKIDARCCEDGVLFGALLDADECSGCYDGRVHLSM